jgi:hypothetical protein
LKGIILGSRLMAKIDYMKVIGVLSKTLKMETIDVKFIDKSVDKLEITMGGPAKQEKKFQLAMSDYTLNISFPKDYLSSKEFDRWCSTFEYELEQAFLRNVSTQVDRDISNHILKVTF